MVTKDEARKYLSDVASEQCFWINNGPILKNIEELGPLIPNDKMFVAESGIESRTDVERVAKAGAKAVLVGTTLMQSKNVPAKIKELMFYENEN